MRFGKTMTMGVAMLAVVGLGTVGGAQAEVRSMNLRWATANPAGHPIPMGGERFAKLVEEKSGGKMKVKVFQAGCSVAIRSFFRRFRAAHSISPR